MKRAVALAAVLATFLVGCQTAPWGPMTVIDEDMRVVLASGGFPGTLRIGDRCVTILLDDGGREITLVFRNGQTSWDAITRQIVFSDTRAGVLRLSDGDRIAPGGAGIAEPEDLDQGVPQPRWISPPNPSCPTDLFAVHSVVKLED